MAAAIIAGLVIAVVPANSAQAVETEPAVVSSSWGPDGSTITDSAVTVRWDNDGNVPDSVVPRDASQVIPHSANKTYADLDERGRNAFQDYFGADNGLGGLSVTVSQTQDLVNQSVTVSLAGARGDDTQEGNVQSTFQVFQCWGAVGADGMPNPAATSPDPESCQVGVGSPDLEGTPDFRSVRGDKMLKDGDLAGIKNPHVQFRGIDGVVSELPGKELTQFSRVSTNEISRIVPRAGGTASRSFEMQTGAESPLGCGYRDDAPSTPTCWLVVVPIIPATLLGEYFGFVQNKPSAVSPSLWAQRLQVKLGFQDVAPRCPSGQAQTLSAGSEVVTSAMASWIPGICAASGVAIGFSQLSDPQARQQLGGGSSKLAFGSQPLAKQSGLVYSPAVLGGLAVGLTLDYAPCGGDEEVTEQMVTRCGYADLAEAQAEHDRAGQPVTDLRLNARLIAKLLTQSYGGWGYETGSSTVDIDDRNIVGRAPWVNEMPVGLLADKEFIELNPELRHQKYSYTTAIYRLNVESLRSDASNQLWNWLMTEPDSRAFLDGCADPHGTVINPFFSTRSYLECPEQATALEATAAAKIEQTHSPVGFDQTRPATYPPASTAYQQILWYQQDPYVESPSTTWGRATMVDLFPPVATMPVAAKATFQAAPPKPRFCKTEALYGCASNNVDGEWKAVAARQTFGSRSVLSITTTADAARFQIPTARICDTTSAHCVGANEDSLEAAVAGFTPDTATGMMLPTNKNDYAAGSYPLAMFVYGVVNTKGMPQEQANSIASALEYIAGAGQTPGLKSGMLLPGYAPLPAALVAQASAAVQLLRNPPAATPQAPTAGSAAVVPAGPKSGVVPQAVTVPAAAVPAAGAATQAPTVAAGGTTGATEVGFPQLGIVGGLGAALAAGALSPFFGRRKKITE